MEGEQSGSVKIKLPVGICNYSVYLGKWTLSVFFCKMTDRNEPPTPTALSVHDRPASIDWLSRPFHFTPAQCERRKRTCLVKEAEMMKLKEPQWSVNVALIHGCSTQEVHRSEQQRAIKNSFYLNMAEKSQRYNCDSRAGMTLWI